jgi:hypothetical protein
LPEDYLSRITGLSKAQGTVALKLLWMAPSFLPTQNGTQYHHTKLVTCQRQQCQPLVGESLSVNRKPSESADEEYNTSGKPGEIEAVLNLSCSASSVPLS